MLLGQKTKNIIQKQHCNKINKDLNTRYYELGTTAEKRAGENKIIANRIGFLNEQIATVQGEIDKNAEVIKNDQNAIKIEKDAISF